MSLAYFQTRPARRQKAAAREILRSEAHLSPARKAQVFVKVIPRPRRSQAGWLVFWGLILMNEARGLYFASGVWNAIFG